MLRFLWVLLLVGCAHTTPREPRFAMRVLHHGMAAPFEVFVGPDGWLWVSERSGARLTRVDPNTGASETLLTIPAASDVLGAAFSEDTLFVVYAYVVSANERRMKIASFPYDAGRFGTEHTLLRGLAFLGDHPSGRLQIGPDRRVYMTIGDQGKNQYGNKCLPNQAQRLPTADEVAREDWSAYEGKVLRLERDGAVPVDNPVLAGVRSHVLSYGHRNAQGLAFDDRGQLFVSEHGPKTDDEINQIHAGKNYGWPHVAGYLDDRGYEYANWSLAPQCDALPWDEYNPAPEVPRQRESSWSHPDFTPPLRTLYTVDDGFAYDAGDCMERAPSCWPTIAPSSLAFYRGPGFGRALLVPSLKKGSVFVLPLREDGSVGEARAFFTTNNRYRDIAVSPDARTIYVITDITAVTSGPTQHSTQWLSHSGALLAFTLRGRPSD